MVDKIKKIEKKILKEYKKSGFKSLDKWLEHELKVLDCGCGCNGQKGFYKKYKLNTCSDEELQGSGLLGSLVKGVSKIASKIGTAVKTITKYAAKAAEIIKSSPLGQKILKLVNSKAFKVGKVAFQELERNKDKLGIPPEVNEKLQLLGLGVSNVVIDELQERKNIPKKYKKVLKEKLSPVISKEFVKRISNYGNPELIGGDGNSALDIYNTITDITGPILDAMGPIGEAVGLVLDIVNALVNFFVASCWEPCRDNYDGVGPVCWNHLTDIGVGIPVELEPCPDGWVNDGLTCRKPLGWNSECVYWDWGLFGYWTGCATGGQVVGRLNNGGVCSGDHPDKIDGLCYRKCPPGTEHVPGMPYVCRAPGEISYTRALTDCPEPVCEGLECPDGSCNTQKCPDNQELVCGKPDKDGKYTPYCRDIKTATQSECQKAKDNFNRKAYNYYWGDDRELNDCFNYDITPDLAERDESDQGIRNKCYMLRKIIKSGDDEVQEIFEKICNPAGITMESEYDNLDKIAYNGVNDDGTDTNNYQDVMEWEPTTQKGVCVKCRFMKNQLETLPDDIKLKTFIINKCGDCGMLQSPDNLCQLVSTTLKNIKDNPSLAGKPGYDETTLQLYDDLVSSGKCNPKYICDVDKQLAEQGDQEALENYYKNCYVKGDPPLQLPDNQLEKQKDSCKRLLKTNSNLVELGETPDMSMFQEGGYCNQFGITEEDADKIENSIQDRKLFQSKCSEITTMYGQKNCDSAINNEDDPNHKQCLALKNLTGYCNDATDNDCALYKFEVENTKSTPDDIDYYLSQCSKNYKLNLSKFNPTTLDTYTNTCQKEHDDFMTQIDKILNEKSYDSRSVVGLLFAPIISRDKLNRLKQLLGNNGLCNQLDVYFTKEDIEKIHTLCQKVKERLRNIYTTNPLYKMAFGGFNRDGTQREDVEVQLTPFLMEGPNGNIYWYIGKDKDKDSAANFGLEEQFISPMEIFGLFGCDKDVNSDKIYDDYPFRKKTAQDTITERQNSFKDTYGTTFEDFAMLSCKDKNKNQPALEEFKAIRDLIQNPPQDDEENTGGSRYKTTYRGKGKYKQQAKQIGDKFLDDFMNQHRSLTEEEAAQLNDLTNSIYKNFVILESMGDKSGKNILLKKVPNMYKNFFDSLPTLQGKGIRRFKKTM